jgi:hypothetical protein
MQEVPEVPVTQAFSLIRLADILSAFGQATGLPDVTG